ncbi:hypothetical protein DFH06DRAFT_1196433 [Mycena polygramma]|nr:hypothetical protein DFH06DRAFT_1196433 [Mycena polygramma]
MHLGAYLLSLFPPLPMAHGSFTSTTISPGAASSGMFAGAQNFTVTGQRSLKNVTKNYSLAPVPLDFRIFPLGDIDLQREICLDNNTGVVRRRDRRIYTGKLKNQRVTVAVYQGDGAVRKWQRDINEHRSLR